MVRRVIWLMPAFFFLVAGVKAEATELIVVEAHGLRLAVGTTVDGTKPLSLQDGQAVTLLAANGQVVKLDGPSAAAPDSALKGGGADLKAAIGALAAERAARTSEVGVVRGENDVSLPDPWVVDVSHPGTACVRPGMPVVLWREPPFDAIKVIFSPKDLSWQESSTWPEHVNQIAFPGTMPLRDHTDYVVDLAGKLSQVTVRLIPASVSNDAMRISFMDELGCGNQAGALLASYQK